MAGLGEQIDVWAALVPGRGAYARQVEQKVMEKMAARGLTVSREMVSLEGQPREHVLVQHKVRWDAVATVAVRIVGAAGGDMEMSWWLFEGASGGVQNIALFSVIAAAAFVCALTVSAQSRPGLDFVAVPLLGAVLVYFFLSQWVGLRTKSEFRPFEKVDSQKLAVQVDYALMTALDEVGIDRAEVRVLRHSKLALPPIAVSY